MSEFKLPTAEKIKVINSEYRRKSLNAHLKGEGAMSVGEVEFFNRQEIQPTKDLIANLRRRVLKTYLTASELPQGTNLTTRQRIAETRFENFKSWLSGK